MGTNFTKEDDEILHQILRMVEMKKIQPTLFEKQYSVDEILYSAEFLHSQIKNLKALQKTFNISDSTARLQNIGTILDYLTVERAINPIAVLESNTSLALDLLTSAFNEIIPSDEESTDNFNLTKNMI